MADVILAVVLIVVVGACAEVVRATCRRWLMRPIETRPVSAVPTVPSVLPAVVSAEQTSAAS